MQYQIIFVLILVVVVFWFMYAVIVYDSARDYLLELNRRARLILEDYVSDVEYPSELEDYIPEYRILEYCSTCGIIPERTQNEEIYGKTIFEQGKIIIIYINIRDESGNLRHIDVSTIILVHELAHLLQEKSGHDEEFKEIEQELLEIAYQLELVDREVSIELE